MLLLDWRLALVVMAGFPPLIWLSAWFRRESAIAYRRTRTTIASVIVQFVETFGGIRAVQAFRREKRNEEIFSALNQANAEANLRSSRLLAIFFPGVTLVGNLAIGAVLLYGGLRVLDHQMQVGVLADLPALPSALLRPADRPVAVLQLLAVAGGCGPGKDLGVLDEAPKVAEPGARPCCRSPTLRATRGPEHRVDSVRFGYPEESTVLPDLNLTIPAGQTWHYMARPSKTSHHTAARRGCTTPLTALCCWTGSIFRLLDDRSLRHEVVLITQENFLFTEYHRRQHRARQAGCQPGRDRGGRYGDRRAHLHLGTADGYDEQVGKSGGRLSAGQRQLISFARAFLAAPAVLVLDEATSLLDIPSERLVQDALFRDPRQAAPP